jgi:hypothetical protein
MVPHFCETIRCKIYGPSELPAMLNETTAGGNSSTLRTMMSSTRSIHCRIHYARGHSCKVSRLHHLPLPNCMQEGNTYHELVTHGTNGIRYGGWRLLACAVRLRVVRGAAGGFRHYVGFVQVQL